MKVIGPIHKPSLSQGKIKNRRSKACKLNTLIRAYQEAGHIEDAQYLDEQLAFAQPEEDITDQKERLIDEEIAKLMAELKDELNSDGTTEEQKKDIVNNITELNKEIRARHPVGVNPDCWIGV